MALPYSHLIMLVLFSQKIKLIWRLLGIFREFAGIFRFPKISYLQNKARIRYLKEIQAGIETFSLKVTLFLVLFFFFFIMKDVFLLHTSKVKGLSINDHKS